MWRQFLSNVKQSAWMARPGWGADLVFAAGGDRDLHSRQHGNRDEAITSHRRMRAGADLTIQPTKSRHARGVGVGHVW